MESNTQFNKMQLVKRRMFAMRNGVIADTLRKAGAPFSIIFGLNLPQLVEIAAEFGPDNHLAEQLWANASTRESMLLAPMLVDKQAFTIDDACRWIQDVPSPEIADVLCHRLLRHQPYAIQIIDRYSDSDNRMLRYTALRLMCNIGGKHPEKAHEVAAREAARADAPLLALAARLADF